MTWQKSCGRGPARTGDWGTDFVEQRSCISKVRQRAPRPDSVGPLLGSNAAGDAESQVASVASFAESLGSRGVQV